jgi:hypothetical protein
MVQDLCGGLTVPLLMTMAGFKAFTFSEPSIFCSRFYRFQQPKESASLFKANSKALNLIQKMNLIFSWS